MKGKYSSERAERLHTLFEPEETTGSDQDHGWAGLYVARPRQGGAILFEDTLGFVSVDYYESDANLSMAWEEMKDRLATNPEPEEDDYVIQCNRGGYYVSGLNRQYDGDGWQQIMDDINLAMDENNFYPNVWVVSDHGNFQEVDTKEDEEQP